MLPEEISCKRSKVMTASEDTKPPLDVITKAPWVLGCTSQNVRAYANLPRKYRPLIKLKSSPRDTPTWRRRTAISKSASSRITNRARIPAILAGDRRKTLRGLGRGFSVEDDIWEHRLKQTGTTSILAQSGCA